MQLHHVVHHSHGVVLSLETRSRATVARWSILRDTFPPEELGKSQTVTTADVAREMLAANSNCPAG